MVGTISIFCLQKKLRKIGLAYSANLRVPVDQIMPALYDSQRSFGCEILSFNITWARVNGLIKINTVSGNFNNSRPSSILNN